MTHPFKVTINEQALNDLTNLPRNLAGALLRKAESMQHGLPGSVKRLSNFDIGYRLRMGDYRILFDLKGAHVTVRRILHRRHAYASSHGKKNKGQH